MESRRKGPGNGKELVFVGFMRIKNTGVGAVLAYPFDLPGFWGAIFLRGDRMALLDTAASPSKLRYDGPIDGATWVGFGDHPLPEPYRSACEGALPLPVPASGNLQMLLFKGDRAYWYRRGTGKVSEGPVGDLANGGSNWSTMLPAHYRDQVDALLMDSVQDGAAWRTYVFKGDRVATIDWASGCTRDCTIREGAQPTAGWAKLDTDWISDLDHVVMLPTVSGAKRSLLVKGTKGCVFNWDTGPEKVGELTALMPELAPLPAPYTTQYRPVSGRWEYAASGAVFPIRVDVDGPTSTYTLSGDLFARNGATQTYHSSFTGKASVAASATELVATCTPTWSRSGMTISTIKVVIPRVPAGQAAPAGRLELISTGGGSSALNLAFQSPYFRTIELETDAMAGKPVFDSYDTATATVPPGYRDRTLSVASAYTETGIEMVASSTNELTLDGAEADTDLLWSNSELHAAMLAHFKGYADASQWKLWAFVASKVFDSSTQGAGTTVGRMFDGIGKQRQGLAVFYDAQATGGEIGTREELHTWIHEIGHALNLAHSWDKANVGAQLGARDGYGDLSWMCYSHKYQYDDTVQGSDAYWERFRFSFTTNELIHLRHAFYNNIVPGGADFFVTGATSKHAAADAALAAMSEPLADDSGLALTLSARPFLYGEPVAVEVRLARAGRDVQVDPDLSTEGGNLAFAIAAPSGATRMFRPLAHDCAGNRAPDLTTLTADLPALYASAYLGSGADGQYFTDPGLYRVRALYTAPDGSQVVSNTLEVRVRLPLTADDQNAGELLMGDQTGTLIGLLGSDSPSLQAGNDALSELSGRFADHPLALYAHLAQGANAGRHFQRLEDGRITVRPPDTKDATTQLTSAIQASTGPAGLNNIALGTTMRRLARVHAKAGDLELAEQDLARMVDYFRAQKLPAHVLDTIQAQADTTRDQIAPDGPRPRNKGKSKAKGKNKSKGARRA
ncbi:hypothetical protein ACQEU3_40460 [Spirillospora sp. CA-253888]